MLVKISRKLLFVSLLCFWKSYILPFMSLLGKRPFTPGPPPGRSSICSRDEEKERLRIRERRDRKMRRRR
uniref:Uncharacterized protein n=1 Tax=Oryza sativa subsp. japonica TaxID=39947 RepID=Q69ND0_ORYSJ|nr:hypothetical protein [Oryza sativa Japonica Group]